MAFIAKGTNSANAGPVLRHEILANSITVTVGDSVKVASGFVALGTAGALVFGHVTGIASAKGVGLNTTGVAGAEVGSFVDTFGTSSSNQTVAKVVAEVDCSKMTLYSADPDSAIGTTTGSNLLGYRLDIADEDETDEDTVHASNSLQYVIWGVDPDDSGNHIVSIVESQMFGV